MLLPKHSDWIQSQDFLYDEAKTSHPNFVKNKLGKSTIFLFLIEFNHTMRYTMTKMKTFQQAILRMDLESLHIFSSGLDVIKITYGSRPTNLSWFYSIRVCSYKKQGMPIRPATFGRKSKILEVCNWGKIVSRIHILQTYRKWLMQKLYKLTVSSGV